MSKARTSEAFLGEFCGFEIIAGVKLTRNIYKHFSELPSLPIGHLVCIYATVSCFMTVVFNVSSKQDV